MGRADDIRAAMEAEIAVAEAEERLIAAKAKGTTGDKLRPIKDEVRALRQAYRENQVPDVAPGDAVATPATVAAKATIKRKG